MLIKVKIGHTTNKGDELMLRAISNHFCSPHTLLVDEAVDDRLINDLDLHQQLDRPATLVTQVKRLLRYPGNTLKRAANRILVEPVRFEKGYALLSDADMLLDASGYAYGDPWGVGNLNRMAHVAAGFRKRQKPVVMLPQTLGPFTRPSMQREFRRLAECVDLIYARDETSYQNVVEIVGPSARIRVAPDYTNSVEGIPPKHPVSSSPYACIIPNHRMVDATDAQVSNRYIDFLALCVRELSTQGIPSVILLHDVVHDREVARQLYEALPGETKIIREEDARVVRGIIEASFLVISSRLHGVLNALWQRVPCLTTAWSYKFDTLMQTYGCGDFILSPADEPELIKQKIHLLTEDSYRQKIIESIDRTAHSQSDKVRNMWREIEDLIAKRSQSQTMRKD